MVEIGRNSIIIRNVDEEAENIKKLERRFSLYDPVYHKYIFSAYTKIDNDLYFPGSIGKDVIKGYLNDDEEIYIYNLTAKAQNISYNMKHPPRDDLQKNTINFLMKMKNSSKGRERVVSLETGKGKTYITINTISQLKKKALIIVDTIVLADQWKSEFLKHSDLKESDIAILSGKESIEKELSKKKEERSKIYIAIHRTLSNLIDEDTSEINKLMTKLGIGIRVFDEFHVEYKNICKINALSNVEYTIFLSATPSRSNFNDDSLYGRIFRNIPYFNGKENSSKYHTVIMSKIDSQPSLDIKAGVRTKYGFSAAKWASYIFNDKYEILYDHLEKLIKKLNLIERKKKTVIMLPTLQLISQLKNDLESNLNISVGTFIGEIKKEKRKDELEKMLILTNDKIFDKGVDLPDLEILINCVPLGSLVKTEQIIGRLRYHEGMSQILIDVTDYGFAECINQMKIRKRFYKKKAKKIIELN